MGWRIELAPAVVRQLRHVRAAELMALRGVILALREDRRPAGARKLAGADLWRIRARRPGSDVETLKSARWGKSAILVAWKTRNVAEYWMMLVDAWGNVLQDAQKLPAGVTFSPADSFTMVKNGDILWTTSDNGKLKLFRLPAPAAGQNPDPERRGR